MTQRYKRTFAFMFKSINIPNLLMGLLLLGGASVHILGGYSHFDLTGNAIGTDDAYISYRYAENLVTGVGLVFNPGERVEGYSNLLYVLLIAPAFFVTNGIKIYIFASVLNLLFLAASFAVFSHYTAKYLDEQAFAANLLFALCPLLWLWTASGMETILFLLLQLTIWVLTEDLVSDSTDIISSRKLWVLYLTMTLSVLTRVDGFITPALSILYLVYRGKHRHALRGGMILIMTIFLYTLWRYSYYGNWLPNTYYAKVSGPLWLRIEYGLQLLLIISLTEGLLVYGILVFANFSMDVKNILVKKSTLKQTITLNFVLIAGWIAYWCYIGGDIFHERLLLLLYPLSISACLPKFKTDSHQILRTVIVIFLAAIQLSLLWTDPRFDYKYNRYDRLITLGEYLSENYPQATLATDGAGKIPFFSKLITIDMFGLNDAHIAHQISPGFIVGHNKVDPDYVLLKSPDLIAAGIGPTLDLTAGMTREKYFSSGYEIRLLVASSPPQTPEQAILNVSGLSLSEISQRIENGYRFAVLVKNGYP
jgi:arabinofuranosyltransferase